MYMSNITLNHYVYNVFIIIILEYVILEYVGFKYSYYHLRVLVCVYVCVFDYNSLIFLRSFCLYIRLYFSNTINRISNQIKRQYV